MAILDLMQNVQDSDFSMNFLGSQYAYPLVESVHVLGLALSVGLLALADLRLIGAVMKRQPVSDSLHGLRPWMLAGFVIMFASGGVLFAAEAGKLYVNPLFRAKMVFVVLAGLNALYFEWKLGRRADTWADPVKPPRAAKFAGWASLACWGVVILFGRWIAYGFS
jgi:hypothetical protein